MGTRESNTPFAGRILTSAFRKFIFACSHNKKSEPTGLNDEDAMSSERQDLAKVHSPKNALFIKCEKDLKVTLKFTSSLLLHVSVYDHQQGAYARSWLYHTFPADGQAPAYAPC